MSVFLERQEVKAKRMWGPLFRRLERISLSILIVLAGLAALYGLYVMVFLGSYFTVDDIVLRGHWRMLNAERLIEISEVKQGDNLFLLNVGDVHDRLMMNDWVKEVAVRRYLPHTLLIAVEEHVPAAILVRSDGMYYVDDDGAVFKRVESTDGKDYPFITGELDRADFVGYSEGLEQQRVGRALSIIRSFSGSAVGRRFGISEVHFNSVRGFSAITKKRAIEVLLGMNGVQDRIARLDRFASAIASRGRRIQYILADEAGRVIVKYRTTSTAHGDAGV